MPRDPDQLARLVERDIAVQAQRDARLLRWLRRQVNADLRYWRDQARRSRPGDPLAGRYAGLVADCKAKLGLLLWADHWAQVDVNSEVYGDLSVVMGAVRRLAQGYRERDGWRYEWDLP